MRVLFYSLGGGFGHLCRSLAVARLLRNTRGARVRMLVPRRSLAWVDPNIEASAPLRPVAEELSRWVWEQLTQFRPDLFVVDVFPRGVLGELPSGLTLPKVLLTRWVEPEYYRRREVEEALGCYQAIFTSEPFTGAEEFREKKTVVPVQPIVWTSPSCSGEEARSRLGGASKPLVVALGSGPPPAQERLRERLLQFCLERNWQLSFLSPVLGCESKEVGTWLRGADLVVSAAGYQSYYEIVQAGVPVIFLPQRRKYDNQAQRALGKFGMAPRAEHELAGSPQELEFSLDKLMGVAAAPPSRFQGAEQVVEYLSMAL